MGSILATTIVVAIRLSRLTRNVPARNRVALIHPALLRNDPLPDASLACVFGVTEMHVRFAGNVEPGLVETTYCLSSFQLSAAPQVVILSHKTQHTDKRKRNCSNDWDACQWMHVDMPEGILLLEVGDSGQFLQTRCLRN